MGIRLIRKKNRHLLLSLIYRINKLLFFVSPGTKLKLLLDLEWVFYRLAHEETERIFPALEHPIRQFSWEFIRRKINEESTVCDIGCKYGHISFLLASVAKEVTGIDYDSSAINTANRYYKKINLKFIHADAFEFLKSNDQRFDAAIVSHVLEHIDAAADFLNKIKLHAKYIYIEVPDFDQSYFNHYRLKMNSSLIYSDADHVNEFDRNELKQLLDDCGLIVEHEEFRYGVQKVWCKAKANSFS